VPIGPGLWPGPRRQARWAGRDPWTLIVKRPREDSRGVTRQLRRSGCRSSGSRARSRPAGWTVLATQRRDPGRDRVARRSRPGRRVRPSGRLRLPVQGIGEPVVADEPGQHDLRLAGLAAVGNMPAELVFDWRGLHVWS
jgi:hypothetical protein